MKFLVAMSRPSRRGHLQSTTRLIRTLRRTATWIVCVLALHILAMIIFEGMVPFDALWLTATTVMTVGYGDLSAATVPGRISTMVLMYMGGIYVLAKAVGDYTDYRAQMANEKARGSWRWNMRGHLLIIGQPVGNAEQYFIRLTDQIRAHESWIDIPILLLTEVFRNRRLPSSLADRGIALWTGNPTEIQSLEAVTPADARAVVVLAESGTDSAADAGVFDTVDRIRGAGFVGPIVAECVDQLNRSRLMRAGATTVIRSVHGFPEMAARALVAPGAERLVENLFTAEGDECRRYELPEIWHGTWTELTLRLVTAEIGIPLGYADPEGCIHSNPVGRAIEARAIFVIVHDRHQASAQVQIARLLRG
ncbi:potassium channel family protein [Indioceanicola profundi]|uniref:potassium channel family protein n=1 Tax=Indioceanicola profundi TaxID=2220096 RepID=UPI0013C4C30E|nr:potassium channel family protein [Indioceanicola profundi]